MRKRLFAFLALIAIPIAGNAQLQSLVSSNTVFAFNLYGHIATNSGNLFLSPYSISTCLAMTYEGARGNTAQEMAQVFGFGTNQEQFAAAFGDLQRQIEDREVPNVIELHLANALWTQEGFPFLTTFLQSATGDYQASVNQADFATSADAATQAINRWVAQQTQNRIQDMLAPGSLNSLTRLVLANAIYFKGTWNVAFSPTNTTTQVFNVSSSLQVTVPMMHEPAVVTNLYNYVRTADYEALELPYASNRFSMLVLLPAQVDGYKQLEAELSLAFLANVKTQMKKQMVEIYFPKFSLESDLDLKEVLSALGMPSAFEQGLADFSGLDGMTDLYLSLIRHKAWIDVDEAGTEAAAATVTGITTTVAPGNPVFRADHPFLFFIREERTGSLLFLGRLLNPSQAAQALPQIKVTRTNGNTVALSWPLSAAPFVLQESSSLIGGNWTTLTNAPSAVGEQKQLVLPHSSAGKFYRLMEIGK